MNYNYIYIRKHPELQKRIAASPFQRTLVEYFEAELAHHREAYENTIANEHQRAVVLILRDVVNFFKDN